MNGKKYLLVTAGGSGTRMGSALPKQFMLLGGVPILRRTIEIFLRAVPDIQVITVLPEAHVNDWREYCVKENFLCPQRLVKGGFTRFHSVKNALKYVPDDAVVAVHDGVRPLITAGKIRELFDAALDAPAVIPVLPVTDTLKLIDRKEGQLVSAGEPIDRSRVFGAQTPQVFQAAALKAAKAAGWDKVSAIAIVGVQGDPTSEARLKGFIEGIEGQGGDYYEDETQYADSVADKAVNCMEGIIQTHPEGVSVIFCNNDDMAMAAARAAQSYDAYKKTIFIGAGGTAAGLQSILNGEETMTVTFDGYDVGYKGVQAAVDAVNGKKLESFIASEGTVVGKDEAQDMLDLVNKRLNG